MTPETKPRSKKTALITGAYRGLGLEVARNLLNEGYDVVVTARKVGAGEKAVETLVRETKGHAHFVALDINNEVSIREAVKETAGLIDHLDVLINNAGVFPDPSLSPLETSREMLMETFATNTVSALRVTNGFLPLLKKSSAKPARVINISSGLGALGEMQAMGAAYSISKTALNAVTCQLAAALKEEGIVVNSVCPGWCRTDMGGENAPRSPEEGAAGISWLATTAPKTATGKFWRDRQEIAW